MLSHCNKEFSGHTFYVNDKDCILKKVECAKCQECGTFIFKEYKTDFHNRHSIKLLKGKEAEIAYQKAYPNRLLFISKLDQGTLSRQHWCFGDYKKSNQRDKKGRLIQVQIKRNFNGQEVENFGMSEVIYK